MHLRVIESHLSLDYLDKYAKGDTFVETGTYRGDTVWLALEYGKFKNIFSIELNEELYQAADKLFSHKPQVKIFQGDSIDCLEEILFDFVPGTCTFWLDAHASGPLTGGKSGGCPLLDELELIRATGITDHTIFIDDRRLFGSDEWSGVTEAQALNIIKKINTDYRILHLDGFQEKDILCATVVQD